MPRHTHTHLDNINQPAAQNDHQTTIIFCWEIRNHLYKCRCNVFAIDMNLYFKTILAVIIFSYHVINTVVYIHQNCLLCKTILKCTKYSSHVSFKYSLCSKFFRIYTRF
jgi:hypothetical protein